MAGKPTIATLVPIRNMNRALRFYTKTLGGKLTMRGTGAMKDMWASVRLAKSEVWLIAPGAREKRKLAYTTFIVPNIKRFVAGLQRKGVKFDKAERMGPSTRIEGPIAFESFGASAFFKDPEGNLWMVWQNMPDS
ncbi:MAG TPA: VOC family protein [Thermoplasmata archaeon]|nr:VOC family protein [Thermoplasmata archaeon]